jgi:hypothetical protein
MMHPASSPFPVAHFDHVYAYGDWAPATYQHLAALEAGQFDGRVFLGVVGDRASRLDAIEPWTRSPLVGTLAPSVAAEATAGSEAVSIDALRRYALNTDGAIMYAHTKGAFVNDLYRAHWRESMTRHVVAHWRENLTALHDYDAIGCHWLTPEQHGVDGPFFGGNFWIARCDYVRTLPPCGRVSRFDAERWLGLNQPRVYDLLPGYPSESRFTVPYRRPGPLCAGRTLAGRAAQRDDDGGFRARAAQLDPNGPVSARST